MSNYTYETVPTQLLPAEGVRYGNCRLAMAETVPLEFFGYLTQTAASEVGNV